MNSVTNTKKLHYKMYKAGKTWCFAAIMATTFFVQFQFAGQEVTHAATTGQGQTEEVAGTSSSATSSSASSAASIAVSEVNSIMALVTTSSSTSSQAALEAEIEKIEAENTANYSSKVSTFLNEIIESAINGWTQYK
ncbi:KxYKxGKxW signal peptide domain-containing protein, partial [Oenococcus oeni]|uniref:KxYKxGKxW signal peptide domain-containing protein n=1 Tax=Oenococcus oeni TaxID=1247 RepID=UPI000A7A1EE7